MHREGEIESLASPLPYLGRHPNPVSGRGILISPGENTWIIHSTNKIRVTQALKFDFQIQALEWMPVRFQYFVNQPWLSINLLSLWAIERPLFLQVIMQMSVLLTFCYLRKIPTLGYFFHLSNNSCFNSSCKFVHLNVVNTVTLLTLFIS